MAVNIEIKARVDDLAKLRKRVEEISDVPGEVMQQEDTFFNVPNGRLKLRVLAAGHGELIYYERGNLSGPRQSNYVIYTTANPGSLKAVLSATLGIRGKVRKHRWLFKVKNTRIHLDEVESLGAFLELEVVLDSEQTVEEGKARAAELMAELGIEKADLVETAYIDLLESRAA